MTTDWIMTASGRPFWPLEPREEDVAIEDIAHHLSHLCRFAGAVRSFYSVAQHSVLVSVSMGIEVSGTRAALFGLLHDASEAYLLDMPRPLKRADALAGYRAAEARLQAVIYRACGLDPAAEPTALLKQADRRALRTEQRDLMPPPAHGEDRGDVRPFGITLEPWTPQLARWKFLSRFAELTGTPAPTINDPGRPLVDGVFDGFEG